MARRKQREQHHEPDSHDDPIFTLWDVPVPAPEDAHPSDDEIVTALHRLPQDTRDYLVSSFNADLQWCRDGRPGVTVDMGAMADDVPTAEDMADVIRILRETGLQGETGYGQFGVALELALYDAIDADFTDFLVARVTQHLSEIVACRIMKTDIAMYDSEFSSVSNIWSLFDVRKVIGSDDPQHGIDHDGKRILCGRLVGNIILDSVRYDGRRFGNIADATAYLSCKEWASTVSGQKYAALIRDFNPQCHMDILGWDLFTDIAGEVISRLSVLLSEQNLFAMLLANKMYSQPAMEYLLGDKY